MEGDFHIRLYVSAFRVVRAQLGGEFVEDAVDEFVSVGAAEGFGHFDGFVDDDGVGGFQASRSIRGKPSAGRRVRWG